MIAEKLTGETNPPPATRRKFWDGVARGYIPQEPLQIDPELKLHHSAEATVDPVTYEVIRCALANINLEHGDLLQRLSLSPVVMLARDFQTSLLTESGDAVHLGAGVQYFSNLNSLTIKYILENRSAEGGIGSGDMLLCNDPYIGGAHQSDVTIAAPIFVGQELFCWIANSMHFQDVGGSVPGSQCISASDTWQEPMLFPPVTLVREGKLRRDVEDLFVRQSRFEKMTRMDLRASVGGIGATREKLERVVARYGPEVVKSVMYRMLDAAEQLFVERLRPIPDGRWSHRAYCEASIPGDRTVYRQQINITKRGDKLIVDNEGTDPQKGAINLSFAAFSGCVLAALTQQMVPELAGAYGGAYRRVEFNPTSGLLNCAEHPAAVSASGVTMVAVQLNVAGTVVAKMLGCADEATRRLTLGPCAANLNSLIGAGLDASGAQFLLVDANGLMGSLAGRPQRDGVDSGGQWWIPDATAFNSEDVEAQNPVLVLGRQLMHNGTGGAGRHRAGVGFRETLTFRGILGGQIINYQNENFATGQGLFGGNPGDRAQCRIKYGTDVADCFAAGRVPASIDQLSGREALLSHKGTPFGFKEGDVVEWVSPAAPGYGDPLLREPALVLADFQSLLISEPEAERIYGVMIHDGAVDESGTAARRVDLRRARLGGKEPLATVPAPQGAQRVGDILYLVADRWWCNGADLGAASDNYKNACVQRETLIRHLGPEFSAADAEMADRIIFREYLCPVTGGRIDTELLAEGDEALHDIRIVLAPADRSTSLG